MSRPIVFLRLFAMFCLAGYLGFPTCSAQPPKVPAPFQKIEGKFVDIVTDLPVDEDLQELPEVFAAAIPIWCRVFDMDVSQVASWRCTAYVMLDRKRFETAGLIPNHLPDFPYGYQYGDQLWVSEQPGAYYRRHLLLHEGTHWFMNRKYGQNGPPWLMEGMAEWLATHRWDSNSRQLTMGIIPSDKDEVPYWGRISLIQKQLTSGLAPSLETVMRYGNTAHQQVDAYAWSWAAVMFMQNHPHTKSTFQALLRRPMQSDMTLTRWLFARLRTKWPEVRQEWNAMLTDIDYGYDLSRGMLTFSNDLTPLPDAASQFVVRTDQSWQASGMLVRAGEKIALTAEGEFVVCSEPQPWKCFPEGVTLEYYRGVPLGKLMMTIVASIQNEPDFSTPIEEQIVGGSATLVAPQSGELHFRVNEKNADLADNEGLIKVTMHRE